MTGRTTRQTGRGFAYGGVLVGLGVSVWANVAHAMTAPATAPKDWHADPGALGLAGFWPLILFLALEVLTRTSWREGRGLWVARGGVTVVAAVAAVVSYLHLHGLLDHYGEATVSALIGPLAIDGLMAVSTAALFAARPAPADEAGAGTTTTTGDEAPRPSPSRSSDRPSRASSSGSSGGSSGKARPVDDERLRALVAQARAERPGAGEPAVRRLLADAGLSASAARVRAALTAPARDEDGDHGGTGREVAA